MDSISFIVYLVLIILAYLLALKTARGRAARFEYGTKFLLYFFLDIILTFLYFIFLDKYEGSGIFLIFITGIYDFLMLIIIFFHSNNVIRRFYDMGKPSIFALTVLIPIYGWIWLIIAFFADSQKDLNEHDESIDFKKLFPEIFSDLDLIIENNLTLIKIKGVKVFIRKENYRYTIVAGSDNYYLINNYIRECSPNFLIIETGKYTYCKHIKRAELEKIIRENTNVI